MPNELPEQVVFLGEPHEPSILSSRDALGFAEGDEAVDEEIEKEVVVVVDCVVGEELFGDGDDDKEEADDNCAFPMACGFQNTASGSTIFLISTSWL